MTTRHRLTIRTLDRDPRIHVLADAVDHLGIELRGEIDVADVVFVEGRLDADDLARLHDVLVDPLLQCGSWELPTTHGIEITLLPGVTDTAADAVLHAARVLGLDVTSAAMGRRVEFDGRVTTEMADDIVRRLVANPVIERWSPGTIEPPMVDPTVGPSVVDVIAIRGLDDDGLATLNEDRALYLDIEELRAIRDQYERLGRDITDVEIEVLAQTWSEHCSHKTFRASIEIDPGGPNERTVEPLLAQLRRCTEDLDAPFVRSAFVGNAGVIEFAEGTTIALKAETHNHPSAVEPFGGANTGVGGVIRDVLGIAHRPIAVTDVLCFGPADLPLDDLPAGALHPRRIRDGVIDGVADYGNKIGLPTVAGAILYDPAYTTNPLVFAGCIGSAPTRPLHTGPVPGDRVVVLGGSTGRDGIRGATFSSATMDATTGEVAGASVQIGDPVVEKLLIDALVGAEDLYSAITDCGAGGLSSAVGEMAEGIGADVELELVPRKYPGLQAWEVWLSEAQERMVIAVAPVHLDALRQRCDRVGVAVADIGVFTGDGRLIVRDAGHVVADIDTGFLHDGRPQRRMTATLPTPDRTAATTRTVDDPAAILLELLAHPNIASKATTIHRYDHEILGATVVRPLSGVHADGPADGVVLASPGSASGLAVGIGVNPWYGLHDPEAMADAAVDEAIRNVVAVGADPAKVALLDNFSWGDPRRPSTLGELVAAVEGCCSAGASLRCAIRLRQGLPQQRVRRCGWPPPRRATDVGDHCGRAPPRRRQLRDHRSLRAGKRPTAHRPDPHGIRGFASRPASRCTCRARHRADAGPRCTGRLPQAPRRHAAGSGGGLSRCQRRWPRRRGGGDVHCRTARRDDHLAPPRRPRHGVVRGVLRPPRRRGAARAARQLPGRAGRPGPGDRSGQRRVHPGVPWRRSDRCAGPRRRVHRWGRTVTAVPSIVIAGPGTNRDRDVELALELAGASVRIVLADELVRTPSLLADAKLAVVAGGFSYADSLGAGRMLALDLTAGLGEGLRDFVDRGRPVLGICNGFQVLTGTGLLPGALGHNEQGRFDCRWVELAPVPDSVSVWTRGIADTIHCPIAHGEGRYVHPDPSSLAATGQVALRYASANPNGSVADIAGVCDPSGVVLGLMPHPENHVIARQHPRHHRGGGGPAHLGLRLFDNGVRHASEL